MRTVAIVLTTIGLVCVGIGDVTAKRNPDTGPGCGLGTVLWSDYRHPKNIAPQVLMFTTNGILFNTVSMSFGISGCTNDGTIMAEHRVNAFVALNHESLAQDMARGEGEHLASLAALLGVPRDHQAEFFAFTQRNYTALLASGEASPTALTVALRDAMAAHPVLAQSRPSP